MLLGGFLGSIFSFCQFLVAPWIGILADKYGRRRVLLASMVGNVLSTLIWIQSTSFVSDFWLLCSGSVADASDLSGRCRSCSPDWSEG